MVHEARAGTEDGMLIRSIGAGSMVCLAAIASGCASGTSAPSQGTITGVAQPCFGIAIPADSAQLAVTVTLSHQGQVVARQTVRGSHTYRFTVAHGSYVVASQEGEGSSPVNVALSAGRTAHVDIPSHCL
jgi:hypothetical protein